MLHLGLDLKHTIHQAFQTTTVACRQRRVFATQYLQHQSWQAVPIECSFQRRHLIQNAAQGPDIALVVIRLVLTDLWRQVVGRANLAQQQQASSIAEARSPVEIWRCARVHCGHWHSRAEHCVDIVTIHLSVLYSLH